MQVSKVTMDRRLSKRCATHVYISRLIQALKMAESQDRMTLPQNQIRPYEEGLKKGNSLNLNNINGAKNGSNGVVSTSSITNAIANKNLNGAKSGVLLQRLHEDQPLSALASEQCAMQKQVSLTYYIFSFSFFQIFEEFSLFFSFLAEF